MTICTFFRSAGKFIIALTLFFQGAASSYALDMAITVDDLPIFGTVNKEFEPHNIAELFIKAFKKFNLTKVYGFVNAQQLESFPKSIKVLLSWLNAGHMLGNHTYSHFNLDHISADLFIKDIQKNEPMLRRLMVQKNYHYFRYPFLEEGTNLVKHKAVRDFLDKENYQVAEVTIDFSDWEWDHAFFRCLRKKDQKSIDWLKKAYVEEGVRSIEIGKTLSEFLFERQVKHIFLMHIGAFQALMLEDLLRAMEAHGVNFITLDEAVTDPIYRIRPMLTSKRTDAFLTQVRMSRKLESPKSVREIARHSVEGRVHGTCK